MALRNVVLEGDDILRKKAKDVKEINEKITTLLDDMWETMREYEGVGLAAPQVGILRRVVIIDAGEEHGGELELINPEITKTEGHIEDDEACLSLPGIVGIVGRPEKVTVRAQNRNGEEITIEGEGLLAKALCHELDHLEGILFIDKALSWEEV